MPSPSPLRPLAVLSALAAAGAAGLGGCAALPSRYVERRVSPPGEVARAGPQAPAPAAAATPPTPPPAAAPRPQPRTLADLVDLALALDPTTRAAWHDARAAAAQAGSLRGAYLPSLDASATLQRQRGVTGGGNIRFLQTTWGASASLTWLLLDLGARGALVDEGDRLLAAARLAEHAAVADLVLRVEETYFQYLAARALVEAEEAAVAQAQASVDAAEGRRRAGLATVADLLQARTALAQARLALQAQEGQALALRGGLATLAGLPPTAALEIGVLPARVDASAVQPEVEELLERAAARNPDLGRARALAEAAEARARAASRALLPSLSFLAGAGVTEFLDPSDEARSHSWSAGLLLRFPTFDPIRPAFDVYAARASADAARARADATAQAVSLDVWTEWQALRTAARRIDSARALVESATASAEVAAGRYREGVGSILDRLNAQAALELARAEDVRARADYLVSFARLARASGRLDLPGAATAAEPAETPPEEPASR